MEQLKNKIKNARKLVEGFKKKGIEAKLNEETGEISMVGSEMAKLKVITDAITPIEHKSTIGGAK